MDTDSFKVHQRTKMKSEDVYADLAENVEIGCDTSNYKVESTTTHREKTKNDWTSEK